MYPVKPVSGFTSSISWQWEIFYTFFKNYNIVPNWINCNRVAGYDADYSDYLEYLYASFLTPTNSDSLMDSQNNTMAPKDYYDYYESLSTHNESQMHSAASLYDYYESLSSHNESQMQSASDTLSLYDYYDFYDYFDTHDDPKPSTACTTGIDGKVSYTFLPDCPKTVLILCALQILFDEADVSAGRHDCTVSSGPEQCLPGVGYNPFYWFMRLTIDEIFKSFDTFIT